MARTSPKSAQKRPPVSGKKAPLLQKTRSPRRQNATASPKSARPKHTHGGARPGAGRPARDTIPVTVRLHPATLALLGTENRSREIEYAILTFFRYHLQALLASPSTKGTTVPGSPTSTPRPRTKKSAPSEPTPEAQQYARRLHTRLRAAEKAFAADAPELK